jgi:hypothetical protein
MRIVIGVEAVSMSISKKEDLHGNLRAIKKFSETLERNRYALARRSLSLEEREALKRAQNLTRDQLLSVMADFLEQIVEVLGVM